MSDDDARGLERLWRATKSPEDKAAYLGALIRSGYLDAALVGLAARLGDQGAALAHGSAPVEPCDAEAVLRGRVPRAIERQFLIDVAERCLPHVGAAHATRLANALQIARASASKAVGQDELEDAHADCLEVWEEELARFADPVGRTRSIEASYEASKACLAGTAPDATLDPIDVVSAARACAAAAAKGGDESEREWQRSRLINRLLGL